MRTPAAWFTEVGTVALILIPGMVLFTVVWMIPAVLGMVMVFGGPFYAAYFVPTTIARWQAARDGIGRPTKWTPRRGGRSSTSPRRTS
ncbi:hypothetical protein [Cryobacterium sp. 5B3]|uniref:hypothetical protein n=1 Tax=Cryobacterium sp. 5B3 TaxID=3048586 RepID=UPI002AB413E7|nr:hypothetical protein [Cryobacterium sp. 5B3]MDY7541808.1 hypothetical protein [Cryobacterium sp. 5B3]MEB0276369.1 hypothetical protein [Cryobacterium sp. 5B3]